jgi:hypothetical protein
MRSSGLSLGVAVGTLLLLAAAGVGPRPAGHWAPDGFVAQSDSLIRQGLLEVQCGVQDSIVTRFKEGSPEERFYARSYLRADVRSFNSSPAATRSPFLLEGCELQGVDPFYHRIDLPYNRLPRWQGDVRFTYRPLTATLEGGAGQVLEARHPAPGELGKAQAIKVSPDREGASARASLLRLTEPGSPEVLADVFFVGSDAVLADRRDVGSRAGLRVNGFRAPPGRLVRVEPGDWIELDAAGRHTYLVEGTERARTASFARVKDDRVERLFPAARLRPLVEPLSQAMDLAIQAVPGAGERSLAGMDVSLTLDRELHEAVESSVLDWCRERAHPGRPRAASMLVMDGFTGAVRAMPSCPGEPELARYEPLTSRTRERFLRNQNLVGHPIGSAAKPFWAAAVASTYPALLDLEVAAHPAGGQHDLMGCELAVPYGDSHGSDDWVGLEEFLRRSCNRYLVDYATMALTMASTGAEEVCRSPADLEACLRRSGALAPVRDVPLAGGAGVASSDVRVCDRVMNVVLSTESGVVGGSCEGLQLVDAKFAPGPALSTLTNVRIYREPTPGLQHAGSPSLEETYRFGRYRLDAWRSVLDVVVGAGDARRSVQTSLRFAGVSPQAANLALNTIEELRRDWINLLLGGENSRWSNFELAEATARLLTGRVVSGTLADAADPDAPVGEHASLLAPEVLESGVRRRVLHAMELVAGPGGTAARLGPGRNRLASSLAEVGYDLYVVAKTGTPAVERFTGSSATELRQGSVLVMGLLAVPQRRGRDASRRHRDHVSACTLDAHLEDAILEVPPASELRPDEDVALTVAVYLDDLEPGGGAGSATEVAAQVVSAYVEDEVRRRIDGG